MTCRHRSTTQLCLCTLPPSFSSQSSIVFVCLDIIFWISLLLLALSLRASKSQDGEKSHFCQADAHRTLLMILQSSFLTLCYQSRTILIRSRLYSVTESRDTEPRFRPCQTTVATTCAPHARYPVVEEVMDHGDIQPFIHNIPVTIRDDNLVYRYMLFYKNHVSLPLNRSIPTHVFRGDAVIMRTGNRSQYVNMRGRDAALADMIMER